ncbi:MAG: ImmA/IrrE family metallo-endopeptidase [Microbacterium sp.]|nr:ImmA/IrrE family metallo-endopeptidase [Microbacterium sp.]
MTDALVEAFWARGAAEGWSDVDQAVAAAADVVGKPIVVREESFLAAEPVCGFVATLEHAHLVMISDLPEYKVERALARGMFSNTYEHEAEVFADRLATVIRQHRGRPSAFRGVFG